MMQERSPYLRGFFSFRPLYFFTIAKGGINWPVKRTVFRPTSIFFPFSSTTHSHSPSRHFSPLAVLQDPVSRHHRRQEHSVKVPPQDPLLRRHLPQDHPNPTCLPSPPKPSRNQLHYLTTKRTPPAEPKPNPKPNPNRPNPDPSKASKRVPSIRTAPRPIGNTMVLTRSRLGLIP